MNTGCAPMVSAARSRRAASRAGMARFSAACGGAVLALACTIVASCAPKDAPDAGAPSRQVDGGAEVVARVNGLPVLRSDLVAALRAGRLGGSPELVLDELIGLTLVLRECEVIAGPSACSGPGTVLERARAFLDRLFSPDSACGVVRDKDYAVAYERLAGRRLPAGADPHAPEVRLAVEAHVCKGRALKAQRAYVDALRRSARIEVDTAAVEAATLEAEKGQEAGGPATVDLSHPGP